MDAAPPPQTHCEAPIQDVVLQVSGEGQSRDWAAFVADVKRLKGNWIIVTDDQNGAKRLLILRARPDVPYDAVADATENAKARGFASRVTFGEPHCAKLQNSG